MNRFGSLLSLIVSLIVAAELRADEPEVVLARHGLHREGPLYVLDAESEIKTMLTRTRMLEKQWYQARVQRAQVGTVREHQAMIQDVTQRISQIRGEIAAVNQQMNRIPRVGGRRGRYFGQAERSQLTAYRNRLNLTLQQQSTYLNQLKSHPPDPKQTQKLDSEVASRRAEYDHALSDLIERVETTRTKYRSLSKNADVSRAIQALEGIIKPSPKLGPSHEFQATVKRIEKLERMPYEADVTPATEPQKGSRTRKSVR